MMSVNKEDILLEVQGLSRSFGGLKAVQDVSFGLKPGIIKAVIGPNGAGKTTLFKMIAGRLPAESGAVYFKGQKITGLKPHMVATNGICCTFQNTRLFSHMTVLENVMVGRHPRSKGSFVSCMFNLPWIWKEEQAIKESSLAILEDLGLADYVHEDAANVPFGKQRLVEFARALATEPVLLLLDEPAAGLNIYETKELAELIIKIKNRGITILLVEHDMSLVMEISDEIVVLHQGKKLAEGSPTEIQKNTDVIKVYLGEENS
jgi:branched-chain amino acid transport system ATP-binding protein